MQTWIVGVAIAGAIACLLIYIGLSLTAIVLAFRKARAEEQQADGGTSKNKKVALVDPAVLIEAIGKLVEALAKAGPVLWALIGSMLFLLIAAFAAGLFAKVL